MSQCNYHYFKTVGHKVVLRYYIFAIFILFRKWGGPKNKSHDREGQKAKLLLGRAVKQDRLGMERAMKQTRVKFDRSGALPVP